MNYGMKDDPYAYPDSFIKLLGYTEKEDVSLEIGSEEVRDNSNLKNQVENVPE
jgi:hypothetical protein